MGCPDFQTCTKIATKILLKQNIESLLLDVKEMQFDKNIIFDSIQNYCKTVNRPLTDFIDEHNNILKEGCTIKLHNDIYIVLYNDDEFKSARLNWTLAHEIGHIYLGHKKDSAKEEIEAHFFAAQLLMPEEVLREIIKRHGELAPEHICNAFYVSYTAATKRIETLKRKKVCVYGKDEMKLIRKFQFFITNFHVLDFLPFIEAL